MMVLPRRNAIAVFLVFAFAYFLSALIRAITATLSPVLTAEFALNSADLGLLAGGYFLGFAATQLPLGTWLDRYGPKRVILCFLMAAVMGCIAFSLAEGFPGLLVARILCGIGVSACLMAPLTGYRRWFDEPTLLRANSWMLMSGSLGMVASTMPVQWLVPIAGWRPLFSALALLLLLAAGLIAWRVPAWKQVPKPSHQTAAAAISYAQVWRHRYFKKMAVVGFFIYGGLLAMQTLWVVPWMTRVAGFTPLQAASGYFWINVCMLASFWLWGLVNPWLVHRGLKAERLIAYGIPLSFILMAWLIIGGSDRGAGTGALLAAYCMSCTFISLAQPAVGMAFPAPLVGRALSAYNLIIFAGVFVVQWGIGLMIDGFKALGYSETRAFQGAFSFHLLCCVGAYLHFLMAKSHNANLTIHE
jgi:MFS family permease